MLLNLNYLRCRVGEVSNETSREMRVIEMLLCPFVSCYPPRDNSSSCYGRHEGKHYNMALAQGSASQSILTGLVLDCRTTACIFLGAT